MDITVDVGDYRLNVRTAGVIIHNNKILLHKNKKNVNYALMGGRVNFGETSEDALKREVMEELGKDIEIIGCVAVVENLFRMKEKDYHEIMFVYQAEFLKEEDKQTEKEMPNIEGKDDLYYEWIPIDKLQEIELRPVAIKEVLQKKEFPTHIVNDDRRLAYSYIGKEVEIMIDRPLGSKHPKHGFTYPVNYGYVPNTVSGDGEELDCYVLGIKEPLKTFKGKCIAVIHRLNDDDDKLIVVPEGTELTNEEIRELTNFQEQYFESEIKR